MNSSDEGVVGMEIRVAGSPPPVVVFVPTPAAASAGVPALVCACCAVCVSVIAIYVLGAWCERVRVWR